MQNKLRGTRGPALEVTINNSDGERAGRNDGSFNADPTKGAAAARIFVAGSHLQGRWRRGCGRDAGCGTSI
jgi:hypothetical protein